LIKNKVETLLVDATTGSIISVGQKVKKGETVGHKPEGSAVVSPISGTLLACQFDADKHLLCLFIEEESEST
jgi:Na+-translocating ferredoxin:NAD+ oxidoreductase RnfC subunit